MNSWVQTGFSKTNNIKKKKDHHLSRKLTHEDNHIHNKSDNDPVSLLVKNLAKKNTLGNKRAIFMKKFITLSAIAEEILETTSMSNNKRIIKTGYINLMDFDATP